MHWLFCCCPRKTSNEEFQQSLIEKESSQTIEYTNTDASRNPSGTKQTKESWRKEKEPNDDENDEEIDVKTMDKEGIQYTKALSKKNSEINDEDFSKNDVISYRKLSSPRGDRDKVASFKKSSLWWEKVKSDLIYLNFDKENPIYMSYRLIRNKTRQQFNNALDYYLSTSTNTMTALIGRDAMLMPHIDTLEKFHFKLLNLVIGKNYTDIKKEKINFKSLEVIYTERPSGIRWAGVDQILIMIDGLFSYEDIFQYVTRIIRNFGWEELKKTSYIFPYFMTIDQISNIIFPCLRHFAFTENIETASLDLAFEMELIETKNSDQVIIVKCRSEETKQKFAQYDQIKTSLAFFGKPFTQKSGKILGDFFKIIRHSKLVTFFTLKQKHSKWPKQFRMKVKEMQCLDPNLYSSLESIRDLNEKSCEMDGFYYVIDQDIREAIGKFYNDAELQKHEIETPVRKEWDDDATAEDFKVYTKTKLDAITEAELKNIGKVFGFDNEDSSSEESEKEDFKKKSKKKSKNLDEEPGEETHIYHYSKDEESRMQEQDTEQENINSKFSKLYYDRDN